MASHSTDHIYHERQSKELCALHALNNVFQSDSAFTQVHLDNLCHNLSPSTWLNPHKSMLGLGNYDVNVLTAALNSRECDTVWFDKRKDPRTVVDLDQLVGCILNVPNDWKIGWLTLPLNRRHWIALKDIGGVWYNLDSKMKDPELIGGKEDCYEFLGKQLKEKDKELFLIVTKDVQESESWKLGSNKSEPKNGLFVELP